MLHTARGQVWIASCGDDLAKANAALDNDRSTVPKSVVDKWAAALLAEHGPGCFFKKKTIGNKWTINGQHIYKFVFAGT